MVTFTPLTALLMKSAKITTEMVWGQMPIRAGYALSLKRGDGYPVDVS